ncbi:hypothetical protein [Streptomyces microflavus]|uniref:hypothetical protein n=1 Tax=Streptomyces microflavus TaxID=1919 RepID=UPI0033AC040B
MLPEALSRIAAEAGVAVVATAGTDHWTLFGEQVASWLARGGQAERADLARLAETAAALRAAVDASSRTVAARQAMAWQDRFAAVLEQLSTDERHPAAAHLQRLVRDHSIGSVPAAPAPGVIAGENVRLQADRNSLVVGLVNGDVHFTPFHPDPAQGRTDRVTQAHPPQSTETQPERPSWPPGSASCDAAEESGLRSDWPHGPTHRSCWTA